MIGDFEVIKPQIHRQSLELCINKTSATVSVLHIQLQVFSDRVWFDISEDSNCSPGIIFSANHNAIGRQELSNKISTVNSTSGFDPDDFLNSAGFDARLQINENNNSGDCKLTTPKNSIIDEDISHYAAVAPLLTSYDEVEILLGPRDVYFANILANQLYGMIGMEMNFTKGMLLSLSVMTISNALTSVTMKKEAINAILNVCAHLLMMHCNSSTAQPC